MILLHHPTVPRDQMQDKMHSGDISPITGLEWPRGFKEVNIPRLRDNGLEGW